MLQKVRQVSLPASKTCHLFQEHSEKRDIFWQFQDNIQTVFLRQEILVARNVKLFKRILFLKVKSYHLVVWKDFLWFLWLRYPEGFRKLRSTTRSGHGPESILAQEPFQVISQSFFSLNLIWYRTYWTTYPKINSEKWWVCLESAINPNISEFYCTRSWGAFLERLFSHLVLSAWTISKHSVFTLGTSSSSALMGVCRTQPFGTAWGQAGEW